MTKSATLHRLEGTLRPRHDPRAFDRETNNTAAMLGQTPVMPHAVVGHGVELWDRYVKILPWLTEADSVPLGQYVMLVCEWETSPIDFAAARMTLMRRLESDLGMTLASRGKFDYKPPDNESALFDD